MKQGVDATENDNLDAKSGDVVVENVDENKNVDNVNEIHIGVDIFDPRN